MPIDSLSFFGRLHEFSVSGEKEVCLNIVIDLKIPGYAPEYALQFKQDLKNREKEDKKKNTNNHKNESSYLDGGEVQTFLNILIIHIYTKYTIWFDCNYSSYGTLKYSKYFLNLSCAARQVSVK